MSKPGIQPQRWSPPAPAPSSATTEPINIHNIDGKNERFGKATGVRQLGDRVWLGSFEQTTIAVFDVPPAAPPVD